MAIIKAESAQGFSQLPALRQLGLMIGLAASVAIGVAVVLWSQTPNYSLLYGSLSEKDASAVMEALQQSDIPYKIDDKSGALMVPAKSVHEARLKLAASGLPEGNAVGLELLQKEQELGTSQFVEQARYQHALEIELARSIASLRNVSNARVHLAIPKRSVFVREQQHPTASVVLDLYSGRQLDESQVAAIVHLVASSISDLDPGNVTVVDQQGRLLTQSMGDRQFALTSSQFDYTRRLENTYTKRIEGLLSPIVGDGRVRAQVVADIDFTRMERTRESYNPDLPALRAEEVVEERNQSAAPAGVPGALTNQPPEAGTTEVQAVAGAEGGAAAEAAAEQRSGSSSRRSTRNYELDKTISHTRSGGGRIQRLSVAVVLDDRQVVQADGTVAREPHSDKEIEQITALVKDAVGFDATRGDTVNVINQAFQQPQPPEPLPEPALWEQPWVMDLGKQALGALAVLLLVFGVLRPVLKSLAEKGAKPAMRTLAVEGAGEVGEDQLSLSGGNAQQPRLPQGGQYEQHLTIAKGMANQDPGRVAQVVKNWVASDG